MTYWLPFIKYFFRVQVHPVFQTDLLGKTWLSELSESSVCKLLKMWIFTLDWAGSQKTSAEESEIKNPPSFTESADWNGPFGLQVTGVPGYPGTRVPGESERSKVLELSWRVCALNA